MFGTIWNSNLMLVTRHAFRRLATEPVFSLTVIGVLGLGIGANTAIFSVVNHLLLRDLPFQDAERIVVFDGINVQRFTPVPEPRFARSPWADQTTTMESISVYSTGELNLGGLDRPERAAGAEVSGDFFKMLGVPARQGRTLNPADERPGAAKVAILSDQLWRTRFQSDAAIIGKSIRLNGESFSIAGVMAPGFNFPGSTQIWLPLPSSLRGGMFGTTGSSGSQMARLRPGSTILHARQELAGLAKTEPPAFPGAPPADPQSITVTTLREDLSGDYKLTLFLLFGAVLLVLAIACVNVINLLLVRNIARAKEFAVRVALGATRSRTIMQLTAEGCLLALGGGVVALVLDLWLLSLIVKLFADKIPLLRTVSTDLTVYAFTFALSIAAGVMVSLIPAWQATSVDLAITLKEGGRSSGSSAQSAGRRRFKSALGIAEVALAFVLLVATGLLLRSFNKLVNVDPGFSTDRMMVTKVSLLEARYANEAAIKGFIQRSTVALTDTPGVTKAAFASALPVDTNSMTVASISAEGNSGAPPKPAMDLSVSPEFFETLGLRLLIGRTFSADDRATSNRVAVISQAMATEFWPTGDPVGKRFMLAGSQPVQFITVIGVVSDVKLQGWQHRSHPTVYFPIEQQPQNTGYFLARTAGDPGSATVGDAIRQAFRGVDPDEPVSDPVTLRSIYSRAIMNQRFLILLFTMFGGLALVLAMLGIYGIVSHAARQRRSEIGIRLALGASPSSVLFMILKQALILTALGEVIGGPVALALLPLMRSFLFDVQPLDAATVLSVPIVLLGVTAVSCLLPAWKAMSLPPLTALRAE